MDRRGDLKEVCEMRRRVQCDNNAMRIRENKNSKEKGWNTFNVGRVFHVQSQT